MTGVQTCALPICAAALGILAGGCSSKRSALEMSLDPMAPRSPHFPAKAKSVIYLHMAGAPSQLELFDYKPELQKLHNQPCPPSLMEGKRFAFIRGTPKMLGPQANFKQRGESGAWISDNLPHLASIADEVSFLKGVSTDQFNHGPAQLFVQIGRAHV